MNRPPPNPLYLPEHWTPEQALAVFELIDLLRELLWAIYGPDIQQAMRDDCMAPDPRQLHLPIDDELPF